MPQSTEQPFAMPPRSMRTPFSKKLHRLILGIEDHVAIVDRRQCLGDLRIVRMDAFRKSYM